MTVETKTLIQKYFLTVIVFFVLAVVLVVVQLVSYPRTEKKIQDSAKEVLSAWSKTPPLVGERVKIPGTGLFCTWTFESSTKGSVNGYIFVTQITGNAGPYTGVFYYTQKDGTVFCGLAGIEGNDTSPARHGISSRILDADIRQFDVLAQKAGDLK